MTPTTALDMLRLAIEDTDGLHIVWEETENCFKRRTVKQDASFGPIEPISQEEIDRLISVAIRSGQMELLKSIDRDGKCGYDLVPTQLAPR